LRANREEDPQRGGRREREYLGRAVRVDPQQVHAVAEELALVVHEHGLDAVVGQGAVQGVVEALHSLWVNVSEGGKARGARLICWTVKK
jgi:pyridoxine 5'-phosphate synthase PdxJ